MKASFIAALVVALYADCANAGMFDEWEVIHCEGECPENPEGGYHDRKKKLVME